MTTRGDHKNLNLHLSRKWLKMGKKTDKKNWDHIHGKCRNSKISKTYICTSLQNRRKFGISCIVNDDRTKFKICFVSHKVRNRPKKVKLLLEYVVFVHRQRKPVSKK